MGVVDREAAFGFRGSTPLEKAVSRKKEGLQQGISLGEVHSHQDQPRAICRERAFSSIQAINSLFPCRQSDISHLLK